MIKQPYDVGARKGPNGRGTDSPYARCRLASRIYQWRGLGKQSQVVQGVTARVEVVDALPQPLCGRGGSRAGHDPGNH